MIKHVFIGLACTAMIVLQVGFLSGFSIFRHGINLFILVLIGLMLALRFRHFLIWTTLFGLGLDAYSGLGYGIITIALLTAAIIANLLYMNFFSHQTNFSLILVISAMTITYNLVISLASIIFYAIGFSWVYVPLNVEWLVNLGWQLLGTGLAFIFMYVIFHPTIERFREQFMIRRT